MLLDMPMPLFHFLALEVTVVFNDGCFSFWLCFQRFGVDDHISTQKKNVHAIWEALTSSASVMALEDVYDMDAIGLFIVPHQTRH